MKVHSIVNGSLSIVLEPENTVEEEILKALTKQKSVIREVRNQVVVLNKNIKGSVLIGKENMFTEEIEAEVQPLKGEQ